MRRWIPALAIAIDLAVALAFWRQLPERVPIHWGMDGRPNGWASRTFAAFGIPLLAILLWGFMVWVPRIDPRYTNITRFRPSYDATVAATIAFVVVVHLAALGVSLGWPFRIDTVVSVAMGALLIVIGNLLPRARPNFTFGVRTPWTIEDARVWARSNRIGGYLLVAAGTVTIGAAFLPGAWPVTVALIATTVAAFGAVIFSYLAWVRDTDRDR